SSNLARYLNSNTASTDRYVTWFGEFTDSRHNTVAEHYSNMLDHPYADYTYDCTCTDSDVYAYVYPDEYLYADDFQLCNVFWSTSTEGTDAGMAGGTLIHESSHFTIVGGTDDHVYGQSGAKSLAKSDPVSAIDNADSHE
ncbi:zincin, partial [Hymenopellis radicata]